MSVRHKSKLLVLGGILALPFAHLPLGAQVSSSAPAPDPQVVAAYAATLQVPDPRKPVPARVGALTLAQVLDTARTKNPTLLAAERNLRAVKAQELQAGVRQNLLRHLEQGGLGVLVRNGEFAARRQRRELGPVLDRQLIDR